MTEKETGFVMVACPSCGLEERIRIEFAHHGTVYEIHSTVYKANKCGDAHVVIPDDVKKGCGLTYLVQAKWYVRVNAIRIDGESPERKVDEVKP